MLPEILLQSLLQAVTDGTVLKRQRIVPRGKMCFHRKIHQLYSTCRESGRSTTVIWRTSHCSPIEQVYCVQHACLLYSIMYLDIAVKALRRLKGFSELVTTTDFNASEKSGEGAPRWSVLHQLVPSFLSRFSTRLVTSRNKSATSYVIRTSLPHCMGKEKLYEMYERKHWKPTRVLYITSPFELFVIVEDHTSRYCLSGSICEILVLNCRTIWRCECLKIPIRIRHWALQVWNTIWVLPIKY